MNIFKMVVVVGLCASLIFNFFLLTKIDALDNNINDYSNNQQRVLNTVNAQVSQITNAINKIKEDQGWMGPVNVKTEIIEVEENEAIVNFEWQVKELQNESEVIFNYKRNDESEYQSIKAVEEGNGFFKVGIPIGIKPEPIWNSYMIDKTSNLSREQPVEEIKKEYRSENQLIFNYYVSVSNNSMTKSSEINTSYLENLGALHYGYLEVYTDIDRNDNYSVFLTSGKIYYNTTHLKEVHLIKYKDGELIGSEKLERISTIQEDETPARGDVVEFHKKHSDEKFDYSSLKLKAIYSDGSEFEREVYSE